VAEPAGQQDQIVEAASSLQRAAADVPMSDEPSTFAVELDEGAGDD
jgi:hypothetical protein